jgi:hypothetical protein
MWWAAKVPIVEVSWYELWLGGLSRLTTLLFQDVVEQLLASGYLDGTVFKILVRSYLRSFYNIFENRLWESFKE